MRKFLALILALSMVLTSGFVFAEGEENDAAAIIVVKNEDGNILYEGEYDSSVFENYPDGKTYEITGTVDDDLQFEIGNAMLKVNGEIADTLRMKGEENLAMVLGDVGSDHAIVGVNTQNYYDDEIPETIVNTSGAIVTGDAYGLSRGVAADGKSAVAVNGDIKGGTAIDYVDEEGAQHNTQFGDGIYASGDSLVFAGNDVRGYDNGVKAEDNANVQVDGDVIAGAEEKIVYPDGTTEANYEGSAVHAAGKATVEIDGDAISLNDGISAKDTTKTDPETYEEIPVPNRAAVTVNGNVTAENGQGIIAEGQADIKVGGNVTASEDEAISTYGETEIYVGGNVSSEEDSAIEMGPDAKIRIAGDVTSGEKDDDEEASEDEDKEEDEQDEEKEEVADPDEREDDPEGVVEILADAEGTATGELIIEGTLSANDDSIPLVVEMAQDTGDGSELNLSGIPELKIYEIVPTDGEYFQVEGDQSGEATEALAGHIQYIVRETDDKNGSIVLEGVTYDEDNDLMLVREDDQIGVTVTAKKGYRISVVDAGEVAELTDNGDGTWTVTVKRGGGVTISAKIVRKPHQADGKTIRYGHYDFDGDGTKEDLEWRCMSVSSGYARLALISGLDRIPDDFAEEGFTEDEMAGILNGEITELSAYETRKYFKDGKTHPVIFVKLDRIGY